jgi:hypothetical protein
MPQYLLSNVIPSGQSIEPERLERIMVDVTTLTHQMQSEGIWVFALGLSEPSSATVVRRGASGVVLADGPFAETKEYIGGITVIDVPDLDVALDWARRNSEATQLDIEVRPAMGFSG